MLTHLNAYVAFLVKLIQIEKHFDWWLTNSLRSNNARHLTIKALLNPLTFINQNKCHWNGYHTKRNRHIALCWIYSNLFLLMNKHTPRNTGNLGV